MTLRKTFCPANVLLPKAGVDMTKWSVIACDQYTSQPAYWEEVEKLVGDAPSTLRLMVPESFLEEAGIEERIAKVNRAMEDYLAAGLFEEAQGYLYVERTLHSGAVRRGLVGMLDLEDYDYTPGSCSPVRATEGTILERIPPRVKVREGAALELPHIMVLIDDREGAVIEPLAAEKGKMRKCYDFPLMQGAGHIAGYLVGEDAAAGIDRALEMLADPAVFRAKYHMEGAAPLVFAVGDGNHSLATAKTCYERLKRELGEENAKAHPARYALVELVNIHDESLHFEPIHRVYFDTEPEKLLAALGERYRLGAPGEAGQCIRYVTQKGEGAVVILNPSSHLAVGSLQNFLDEFGREQGGKVDYIHGEEAVRELGSQPGAIGFLVPDVEKNDFFASILSDGVLPRKTFSMGHADDKRFYLECRRIR
ncbi:MAG: DUF1015 domain-containing protein [Oscillospiraceae bacterium]|jgi:uncharacterized protein (DUF1015 family)|nr:DUF1015 domain-containing protein [Oscillospiraceae bacterium]